MIGFGLGEPQSDVGGRPTDVSYRPPGIAHMAPAALLVTSPELSAGSGGDGIFLGTVLDHAEIQFSPFNMADAPLNASAAAQQANWLSAEQGVLQVAGLGGDGGNGNSADDRSPALDGQGLVQAGNTSSTAGDGGDGFFAGSLVHTALAVYDPVNIAVAGSNAHAVADQTNTAVFNQSAIQFAGIGGDGGSGNMSSHALGEPFGVSHSTSSLLGTNFDSAGNGGNGIFAGSLVNTSVVLYHPVNIAIAGSGAHAYADQTNDVDIDQHAVQIAGVGGHGGSGSYSGLDHREASLLHLIGSDVVGLANHSAGAGGDGYFVGTSADVEVVVYAPINIAVAGYHATADAHQTNMATIDQSASHVAGLAGHGGDGNLAAGGDWISDLLDAAHHLT
jgi:hypothetical protein